MLIFIYSYFPSNACPPPFFCGVELNIESRTCPQQTDDLALNYINSPKALFYTLYSKLCKGQGYLPLTKRALVVVMVVVVVWGQWHVYHSAHVEVGEQLGIGISIHRGPAHVSSLSLVILTLQPRLVSVPLPQPPSVKIVGMKPPHPALECLLYIYIYTNQCKKYSVD